MLSYIDGVIGENRELTFGSACGYADEHCACGLRIELENADMQGADKYFVHFEISPGETLVSNEITGSTSSPAYIDGDYIYCPLTARLTSSGSLGVQVSAVFCGESEIIVKSGIARINFGASLPSPFSPQSEEYGGLFTGISSLEERLASVENALREEDYGYTAAAVCANLLYKNDEETPLFFPQSYEQVSGILTGFFENAPAGEDALCYVVSPAGPGRRACLCRATAGPGGGTVTAFEGKELLELIKEEMNE